MKSNPTRFWWAVVALGWAFDFLFWKKAPGVNFAIYVALCLVAGLLLLRADGHRPRRNTLLLLPLIVFFAVMTFLRQEPMTLFLSVVMTLFLMGLFAISFLGGRWPSYSLLDYLKGFLGLLGSMIARPLGFSTEVKREQAQVGEGRASQLWPVVRGILIALPIVAIFAALLSSADLVFGQRLEDFIELFRLDKLPEYIFRLAYILVGAYALAGVFLHAASQSKDEKLIGEEKPAVPSFLGFTEAAIVLGSVAVLFLAFVFVQFQYFFGGQANIQIDGYTYSEYARRGFGELVTVAFFSLILILSAGGVTRRETEIQRRVFSGLGIGIVALVLVMLVSAFQRLVLYETAYGFSRLRTYTHVFIFWLALLLVTVVLLEILHRERAFALAAVVASLGFALSLGIMNVDGFIVRQNVDRAVQGETLDVSYLAGLSSDAVPALAAAYRTQPLPASIKEGVGASLACYAANQNRDKRTLPWQSFHLSRANAARVLTSLEADLGKYQVNEEDWSYLVLTPSGKEYRCNPPWD
ncbi:MAG: DUF4173 domain-containing protein [Anaerolineales bacterium]|nr:DUF4173 domain-containing protein [Anaerolineales bacterium]